MCWTWLELPVSLPSVVGVKILKSRKKAVDVVRSTRVDQIEIESADGRTLKNGGDPSYYDEVHPVFNQGPQECQKIK
jgi:hypothetical protein